MVPTLRLAACAFAPFLILSCAPKRTSDNAAEANSAYSALDSLAVKTHPSFKSSTFPEGEVMGIERALRKKAQATAADFKLGSIALDNIRVTRDKKRNANVPARVMEWLGRRVASPCLGAAYDYQIAGTTQNQETAHEFRLDLTAWVSRECVGNDAVEVIANEFSWRKQGDAQWNSESDVNKIRVEVFEIVK